MGLSNLRKAVKKVPENWRSLKKKNNGAEFKKDKDEERERRRLVVDDQDLGGPVSGKVCIRDSHFPAGTHISMQNHSSFVLESAHDPMSAVIMCSWLKMWRKWQLEKNHCGFILCRMKALQI